VSERTFIPSSGCMYFVSSIRIAHQFLLMMVLVLMGVVAYLLVLLFVVVFHGVEEVEGVEKLLLQ